MSLSRRNFLKGAVISLAAIGVAKLPLAATVGKEAHGEGYGEFVDVPKGHMANLVYVYIEADLPDPVGGVITLAPNTEYVMMNPISTTHMLRGPLSTSINGKGAA